MRSKRRYGNSACLGRFRKRKRPRGRRMRGLIFEYGWEEECRIPVSSSGRRSELDDQVLTGGSFFNNG
jgi:hypothetical protein